jgi:ribonucleotide reductase alpha subunit/intein/homing endonuclease
MTRDEAYESCLKYFNGDTLAADVAVSKYLLVDQEDNYLEKDLHDVYERNIREILRADEAYCHRQLTREDLEDIFFNKYAILQGSPLYGLGNNFSKTTLSNCYVVDYPKDSISGIMESAKQLANLFKSRGGAGICLDTLRPEGSKVSNSARHSTGAWSFASLYSDVTKSIGQCVAEGMKVLTKRGLVEIQDVKAGDFAWTKRGWIEVVKLHKNGKKDIYRLTSKFGLFVETSQDHVFATPANDGENNLNEKTLSQLSVGDKIVMIPGTFQRDLSVENKKIIGSLPDPVTLNVNGAVSTLRGNKEAAFIFGSLLGFSLSKPIVVDDEGYFELYAAEKRLYLIDVWAHFLKVNFGIECPVLKRGKKYVMRVRDEALEMYFKQHGFIRNEGEEISEIPEFIVEAKTDVQAAFLSGFLETFKFRQDANPYVQQVIKVQTTSFAYSFMRLLMSVGIVVQNVRTTADGLAAITISGGDNFKRFLDFVYRTDFVPFVRTDIMVVAKTPSRGRHTLKTPFTDKSGHCISVAKYNTMVDKKPSDYLLVQSEVEKIEKLDVQKETYDLELASEHFFYCEGFYIHNSGRRGALMQAISVHHPDVSKFIDLKLDKTIGNASNLSVMFSDEFFKAVENDEEYTQQWPVHSKTPKVIKKVKAKDIWTKFVHSNTVCDEPGALFWDRMIRYTPNSSYPQFLPICVNPCAEVAMAPNSNCRLMTINLKSFVRHPYTAKSYFDFDKFKEVVKKCVSVLDNLVDLDVEKMEEMSNTDETDIHEMWNKFIEQTKLGREIGLGTHALGDCLIGLGIVYGSDESLQMANRIEETLKITAYKASQDLADHRGAFGCYDAALEQHNEFIQSDVEHLAGPRRNVSLLTSAPAGSMAILHQTTSGMEPLFKRVYKRKRKVSTKEESTLVGEDGQFYEEYLVKHPSVDEILNSGIDDPDDYIEKYCVEAHSIPTMARVAMQSVLQRHVDHSISSCVPGNTYISTEGGFRKIEDLVPRENGVGFVPLRESVTVYTHTGRKETITEGYYNGVAETINVVFSTNDKFVGTPQHKLRVLQEDYSTTWKELQHLTPGDWVITKFGENMFYTTDDGKVDIEKCLGKFVSEVHGGSTKEVIIPKYLTLGLSRYLGYLTSDGFVSENGIGLSQTKNTVIEDFCALSRELFGVEAVVSRDNRADELFYVNVHSRILRDFFTYLGVTRDGNTKTIPRIIMEHGGRGYILQFLKGVTLDGHVAKDKACVMTTTSKELARQIVLLLYQLGISSIISTHPAATRTFPSGNTYNCKESYVVSSSGVDAHRFVELVGFAEERKNNEIKSKIGVPAKSRKRLLGFAPDFGLRQKIRDNLIPNLVSSKMYDFVNSMVSKSKRDTMAIERETLLALVDLGAGILIPEILLDYKTAFKKVVQVTPGDLVETFDLCVPVDHSYIANNVVSHNTINLPKTVTEQEVSDLYLHAWRAGLKGVTIYVEGTRDGVLSSATPEAPKERPKALVCDIHHTTIHGEKWIVCVGLVEGKPYEVFCGLQSCLELNSKFKTGMLLRKAGKKQERSIYDLVLQNGQDEIVVPDIVKTFQNKEHMVLGRMLSLNLRSGGKIAYIVEQLQKDSDSDFMSYNKVIARILKKYINDGERPEGRSLCPDCGSELVYEDGCKICKSCGYGGCS